MSNLSEAKNLLSKAREHQGQASPGCACAHYTAHAVQEILDTVEWLTDIQIRDMANPPSRPWYRRLWDRWLALWI